MKGPTTEEVRALQQETGEGMMACKKIIEQRYAAEEKEELIKDVQEIKWMLRYGETRDILEEVTKVLDKVVRRI